MFQVDRLIRQHTGNNWFQSGLSFKDGESLSRTALSYRTLPWDKNDKPLCGYENSAIQKGNPPLCQRVIVLYVMKQVFTETTLHHGVLPILDPHRHFSNSTKYNEAHAKTTGSKTTLELTVKKSWLCTSNQIKHSQQFQQTKNEWPATSLTLNFCN